MYAARSAATGRKLNVDDELAAALYGGHRGESQAQDGYRLDDRRAGGIVELPARRKVWPCRAR
ncbi:hypothetical protein C4B68_02480 [Streptomyces dengpaensis]|uniref:Uncharacterized protein n=1 Tax=Streptomyces dengpaensis TaxID=2049881 RepID=A0ABN5HUQ1_9ACTN|nr:hypothetical protein C4B68_02480 [Streptomyces dengpaensis]PIB03298.1 hypothetical protein B1C81_37600 [Streptomyces sp. HG99]